MFNKTPIAVVPPGYKPDLDRLPPQGAGGCGRGCLWIVLLIIVLGGLAVGAIFALSPKDEPELPVIITTVAYESQTIATATMDYCWFLTPTIEAIPTIVITPDEWALRGTEIAIDVALEVGTPTPTPLPTQEPPKAWCNQTPVMEATATFTPFGIPTGIPHIEVEFTATIIDTSQPTNTIIPTAVPTSTLFPTLIPRNQTGQQVGSSGSSQPQQVIVIQTVIVVDKVVKVITATSQPTATQTATEDIPETTEEPTIPTSTATDIPTVTMTPTATQTATYTATSTATHTATASPTATTTYTATSTATQTATDIPTSTLFPTLPVTATETETVDNA